MNKVRRTLNIGDAYLTLKILQNHEQISIVIFHFFPFKNGRVMFSDLK